MFKSIIFALKYKVCSNLLVPQFNESCNYTSKLDYSELNKLMKIGKIDDELLSSSSASMFKLIGEYEIFTRIASCVIKPRFGKWKKKNADRYCKDIENRLKINKVTQLVASFFLFNPLFLRGIGISLAMISQKK